MKSEANNTAATVIAPKGSSFLVLALLCVCQSLIVTLAQGAIAAPPSATDTLVAITDSIEAIDCTAAECAEIERLLIKGNPGRLPAYPGDLPSVSADRAHHSARYDQEMPLTTNTNFPPIVAPQPGTIPAFLFSSLFTETLHAHLRERAPPSLA